MTTKIVFRIQAGFLTLAVFVLLSGWSYTWMPMEGVDYGDTSVDEYDDGAALKGIFRETGKKNNTTSTINSGATAKSALRSSTLKSFDATTLRPPRNIFDCGSDVQDPQCLYFDPFTYFNPADSPLPPHILDSVQHYWSNRFHATNAQEDLFWFSIQQDVGVYNLLEWENGGTNPAPSGWPRTLMGLHIHKCGGSSVGRTFLKVANKGGSNNNKNGYSIKLFYKNDLRAKFKDHGAELLANRSTEMHHRLLQKVYDNQQQGKSPLPPADHVAFTFVREPVGRFLSSVREFLVSRNKRKRLCLEAPTSKDLLKCFLSKLKQNHGLQLDQHFAPATISLYMFSLLQPRAKISILPLTDTKMAEFQTFFLGPQHKPLKLKSSKPRQYNVTMDELDAKMIQDICNLYAMDVFLLRHLGMPVGLCEGSIL